MQVCETAASYSEVSMGDSRNAYFICGTPRSGTTLLCEMLYRSGIAGRPNSYFREVNIAWWAEQWGVAPSEGTDQPTFDRSYLAAMREVATAGTGIFGLRIMYRSLEDACRRLQRALALTGDLPTLFQAAFGSPLYVHVSRADKLSQAISLVRAEQTGLWHLNADGSVLEGAEVQPEPVYDRDRIGTLLTELEEDDRAWGVFFAEHGITPLRLTYETLAASPQQAMREIFAHLGLDQEIAHSIAIPTSKMADATSQEWAVRFEAERETS